MDLKRFSTSNKLVIIEFWSNNCLPCKNIKPFLDEISNTYKERLSIIRINIHDSYSTAEKYEVIEIPTFIFLKNQDIIFRMNGFKNNINFEKVVRQYI